MIVFFIAVMTLASAAGGWVVYYFSKRASARRAGRRLSKSLAACEEIFSTLDVVPNRLLSRDLRRGLVLIVSHHMQVLQSLAPRHPHLWYLQNRLQRLNKIPSAFEKSPIRCSADRKRTSLALEALSGILKSAAKQGVLGSKQADLAAAAATFAAQHIAVEGARQAAKDAENVRAYGRALTYAHQAQALCRKLPPLMGDALIAAVNADVERIEALRAQPRRALTG